MSIGESLADARRQSGLSTQDVADATRIRRTLVEAIERDDYSLCGGDVYARGHIRTIAKVVGVDPEPLLKEFRADHDEEPPTVAAVFEAEMATGRAERRGPNWTAAMAAALVALVAFGVFQATRSDDPGQTVAGDEPSTSASTSPSAPAPSPSAPAPSPSPTLVAEVPPTDGVNVRLTVSGGASWVAATQGDAEVFSGTLPSGTTKDFTDPARVKLVIGNAGATRLVVNGVDLGAPGQSGEVVRLTFGPGDPTAAGAG